MILLYNLKKEVASSHTLNNHNKNNNSHTLNNHNKNNNKGEQITLFLDVPANRYYLPNITFNIICQQKPRNKSQTISSYLF
uniref:Uncharacterized protein n=1 Tax=Lepeophtheirus salmonis TaxID=72036 RepID=A0A0K2VCD0_LEPSM